MVAFFIGKKFRGLNQTWSFLFISRAFILLLALHFVLLSELSAVHCSAGLLKDQKSWCSLKTRNCRFTFQCFIRDLSRVSVPSEKNFAESSLNTTFVGKLRIFRKKFVAVSFFVLIKIFALRTEGDSLFTSFQKSRFAFLSILLWETESVGLSNLFLGCIECIFAVLVFVFPLPFS